ncbi:MAG: C/D box methylation guide ribonucleoprotein complex aNOP56 subunit [Candidatus Bathyarchaeota archaeon]|nr:C/D box methylation guide ribonucleoprotein complex aNOP56 subunit [Candidatus Bathyarchaeota archaeon]
MTDVTRAHIEETLIGVFAIAADGRVLEKALYPKEPEKIARAITRQRNGEITKEVLKVAEGLMKRGFDAVTTTNPELAETLRGEYTFEVDVVDSGPSDALRDELPAIARQNNMVKDEDSYYELGRQVSTLLTRGAVQDALGGKEAQITQTVQLLGELDTSLNGLSSRVREWYGLHYPELSRIIREHESYLRFITEIGDRASVTQEKLDALGLQRREAAGILKGAEGSMGAPLQGGDLAEVQRLAQQVLSLYEYRGKLTEYISGLALEAAPNVSALAGPTLAAKLIEKAGGIKRMAMMPSSTLQILGAEKALFRAVKTNAKPPKHGLIFQHPYVNAAPRGLRGLRARHLAAKLSIAARADAFSGNFIAEQLKKDLDEAAASATEIRRGNRP